MIRRLTFPVVALLATLLSVTPGSAQRTTEGTRVLTGTVVDTGGGALEGAAVRWEERGTATDAAGRFRLEGLPPREIQVTIGLLGYGMAQRAVDLTRGDVDLVVVLQQGTVAVAGVEVTAESIQLQEALRDTRSVARMTAREISRERGQTLGATLQDLPGVSVIQYGPSIAKPVVRGLHSHRVIMMNGGVRQEGQQWGSEHAPEVDVFAPDEIRVVKGPGSVLYGSDALGGVVRLEPRPLPVVGGLSGELVGNAFANNRQGAGSLLLEHASLPIPLLGPAGGSLRVSARRAGDASTPGYTLRNTGFSEVNAGGALGVVRPWGTSELRLSRFSTELGLFTGAHVGNFDDLQRAMTQEPTGRSFSYDIRNPRQEVVHTTASWRTRLLEPRAMDALDLTVSWQQNDRKEFDSHGPLASRNIPAFALVLTTWTADVTAEHRTGPFRGTLGISGLRQGNVSRGKSFLIPQYRLYSGAIYGRETLELGRLTLDAGLRWDHRWQRVFPFRNVSVLDEAETRTWSDLSGSLGGSVVLGEGWSVASSVGRGWRAPNVNERFSQGVHHGTAQYELGDPDLGKESTLNLDLTLRRQGERFSLEAGGFRNRVDGYMYLEPRDPILTIRGAFPAFNHRQIDALLTGGEVMLRLQATRSLEVETAVNVVRGSRQEDGLPLHDMPADRFSASLRMALPELELLQGGWLKLQGVRVREQTLVPASTVYALPTEGYTLVNLEGGADLLRVGPLPLDLTLSIRNLLDRSYRDYLSRYRLFADDPGRDVVLRFTIPFGG